MSLKSETSRVNGAKSKGPKTPETKQISSRNALRHGLTSRHTIVLECEDKAEFDELHAAFYAFWRPSNIVEQDLVDDMVAARWRLRRLSTIETAAIDTEVQIRHPELQKQYEDPDLGVTLGQAVHAMAAGPAFGILARYHTRLCREYKSTLRLLHDIQGPRSALGRSATPVEVPAAESGQPSQPVEREQKPAETAVHVVASPMPEIEDFETNLDSPRLRPRKPLVAVSAMGSAA
ncbi:MAG: hypothetical protein ABIZ80_20805 [Bryobacteraceae bacterium]